MGAERSLPYLPTNARQFARQFVVERQKEERRTQDGVVKVDGLRRVSQSLYWEGRKADGAAGVTDNSSPRASECRHLVSS